MHFLADALQAYYAKSDRRIIFRGNISFQDLTLSMWQELNYRQLDQSVLSRVLKGKRLFTPHQLFVFCKVLRLSSSEVEHLFHSLYLDYLHKDGVAIEHLFLPTQQVIEILQHYIADASFDKSEVGKKKIADRLFDFIQQAEQFSLAQASG